MSSDYRRNRRRLTPGMRFLLSVASVCFLLFLSGFAFRYCLSLFVVGDEYLIRLPGRDPIAQVDPNQGLDLFGSTGTVTQTSRATILAAGDLMTHLPIIRSGATGNGYSFENIFQYVSPYIASADYAVVNLETTLAGTDGKEYTGYPKFNAPDAIASSAYHVGFDMMLTANNHCYDYGTAGLLRTLDVIQNAGLDTLGTISSVEENPYMIKDINGIKVGMVNYTYADITDGRNTFVINDMQVDSKSAGLINIFDYANLDLFYSEMEGHIADMRAAGAEAIVLFIHWGDQFSVTPSSTQEIIAQKMCDLGVDVIAGSHPHVVQPIAQLTSTDGKNHTICMYSMGNFLSNQRADNIALETGHSEDGLMFSFTFVKYSNGEVHVEFVNLMPTWVLVRGGEDNKSFQILPLDADVEDWNEVYSMDGDQTADANKSLERTHSIIWQGLADVQKQLQYQVEDRGHALGTFTGGVG